MYNGELIIAEKMRGTLKMSIYIKKMGTGRNTSKRNTAQSESSSFRPMPLFSNNQIQSSNQRIKYHSHDSNSNKTITIHSVKPDLTRQIIPEQDHGMSLGSSFMADHRNSNIVMDGFDHNGRFESQHWNISPISQERAPQRSFFSGISKFAKDKAHPSSRSPLEGNDSNYLAHDHDLSSSKIHGFDMAPNIYR